MNSHDIALMVNAGILRTAPPRAIPDTGANVFTIAEDIRARLNATEGNCAPDDSHPNGRASLRDERRVLLALEKVLEAFAY